MLEQLKIQLRVIHALMIREIIALYGRQGLGALWLALEPLTFALPVMILWNLVRAPFEHGIPLMYMLWSGYIPILLFRHIGGRMLYFIRHNVGLMHHRNVTVLDIFIARCTIEVVQNIAAGAIVFVIFYIYGALDAPRDPVLFVEGYIFMIWWCVAIGLIVGALCERSEIVEKIWVPFAYTNMFYNGAWFLSDWLPPQLRTIALYQPSFQAYEMIRGGLLGSRITVHFDMGYDAFVLGIITFFGLAALRQGRRFVVLT